VTKKLLILSFGILAVLAMVLSPGAIGDKKVVPRKQIAAPGDIPSRAPSSRACTTLAYCVNEYYFWTIPDAYGDDFFNMRFTVPPGEVCTLTYSRIRMYGSEMKGTPDMRIYLWDDDGFGFPGNKLDSVDIPYASLPAGTDWVTADWTTRPVPWVFPGGYNFHVGWTTLQSGPGDPDTLACISDDASGPHSGNGEVRASEYWNGVWGTMLNDWGVDVCFCMESDLCCVEYQPGWVPGDPHKMHYPQLPDWSGWDVEATYPYVLAADWECSKTGPVEDVHFWGSWKGDEIGNILYFVLSIHDDIPAATSPTGYSMPGVTLREWEVWEFDVTPYDPPALEGWYDPFRQIEIPFDHDNFFQYDVYFDETEWFVQDSGVIYWLNISAVVEDTLFRWGWKSSLDLFLDDAVGAEWYVLDWMELYEPSKPPLYNEYWALIDTLGHLDYSYSGGTDYYGDGWYFYPGSEWYNIWFYDHRFTYERYKEIYLYMYLQPYIAGLFSYATVAINYSTDYWSIVGNPIPQPRRPPIPPVGMPEDSAIVRDIVFNAPLYGGEVIEIPIWIEKYNPEWISIDIMGENFGIEWGYVNHNCIPFEEPVSLELAFVITGEPGIPPPPEPHEGDINLHNLDGYIPGPGGPNLIGTQWHEIWHGGSSMSPGLARRLRYSMTLIPSIWSISVMTMPRWSLFMSLSEPGGMRNGRHTHTGGISPAGRTTATAILTTVITLIFTTGIPRKPLRSTLRVLIPTCWRMKSFRFLPIRYPTELICTTFTTGDRHTESLSARGGMS
jgi:hypothetical protein